MTMLQSRTCPERKILGSPIQNSDCLCKLEWGMLWMLNSKNNKKAKPKVLEFMYCSYRCVIEWWSSSSNSWSFGSNFCAKEIYILNPPSKGWSFYPVIGVCPPPPTKYHPLSTESSWIYFGRVLIQVTWLGLKLRTGYGNVRDEELAIRYSVFNLLSDSLSRPVDFFPPFISGHPVNLFSRLCPSVIERKWASCQSASTYLGSFRN